MKIEFDEYTLCNCYVEIKVSLLKVYILLMYNGDNNTYSYLANSLI